MSTLPAAALPALVLRLPALLALLLVLLMAGGQPAWAQYRWKDAKGQMHASDQPPPPGIPDKDVLQRPTPGPRKPAAAAAPASAASPAGLAARAPVDPELQNRKARADQETKARAKADEQRLAAQKADNCQRARQHLATLETGNRLVRFNAQGERVVLDDNQRAQEAAQARNVLSSDCR